MPHQKASPIVANPDWWGAQRGRRPASRSRRPRPPPVRPGPASRTAGALPWSPSPAGRGGPSGAGPRTGPLARPGSRTKGRWQSRRTGRSDRARTPVMLKMPSVHHEVDQEHQPGNDAGHRADPAAGPGNDHQRQDRRDDDRQLHPGCRIAQEMRRRVPSGADPPDAPLKGRHPRPPIVPDRPAVHTKWAGTDALRTDDTGVCSGGGPPPVVAGPAPSSAVCVTAAGRTVDRLITARASGGQGPGDPSATGHPCRAMEGTMILVRLDE